MLYLCLKCLTKYKKWSNLKVLISKLFSIYRIYPQFLFNPKNCDVWLCNMRKCLGTNRRRFHHSSCCQSPVHTDIRTRFRGRHKSHRAGKAATDNILQQNKSFVFYLFVLKNVTRINEAWIKCFKVTHLQVPLLHNGFAVYLWSRGCVFKSHRNLIFTFFHV